MGSFEDKELIHLIQHDLKAQVRNIVGYVSALSEEYSEVFDPTAKYYLSRINWATSRIDRMHLLLSDLIRLEKSEIHLSEINLKDEINEIISSLGYSQIDGLRNNVVNTILFDRRWFKRVISILLTNAVTFSKEESPIAVTIEGRQTNSGYELVISDNGTGIDEIDKERLFKFSTPLKPNDRKSGLGSELALSRVIAKALGGDVRLGKSEIGIGTEFIFFIPLSISTKDRPQK